MRTLTIAGALALGLTSPAIAQDWSGIYVGLHAGHGSADWSGAPSYDAGLGPVAGVFGPDQRDIGATGWLGGGQIGFNVRSGSLVWGIEVDGAWSSLDDGKAFVTPDKLYTWDIATRLDALGTVRGRLGVLTTPGLLVYGTGGLALGRTSGELTVTSEDGFDPAKVTAVGEASENHIGWTAGGGVEWALGSGWSLKAEYLYVDLGTANYRLTGTAYPGTPGAFPHTTDSFAADLTLHTVRVGVNVKIGQ